MTICFLMGYASGLPLLLTLSTLQAWMSDEKIDLGRIGLIALVGLPYSWKFVWAPLFDRFILPFLGRRRGWLLLSQLALAVTIAGMGMFNPKISMGGLALFGLFNGLLFGQSGYSSG